VTRVVTGNIRDSTLNYGSVLSLAKGAIIQPAVMVGKPALLKRQSYFSIARVNSR
jgi:hypothetical protein